MNEFKKIILNNGIPLYFYKNENMKKVYFEYCVKYGSEGLWFDFNYDGKDYHVLPGVAHFLEHLLGEHCKYGSFYDDFYKKGYYSNGTTYMDHTSYYFYGKKDIKESIKELIESLENPIFTKEDIELSRYAIIDESRGSCNSQNSIIEGAIDRNIFSGYEIYHDSYSAIGSPETTKNIDYDMLKLCYDAFYYDDNKILVIGGNLDEKEIVDYINSIYDHIPKHEKKIIDKKIDVSKIISPYDSVTVEISEPETDLIYRTLKPSGFTDLELYIITRIFLVSTFYGSSPLYNYCFEKELFTRFHCSIFHEDNYLYLNSEVCSENLEQFKVVLENNFNSIMSKENFEIEKRAFLADEVRKLDFKKNVLFNFTKRVDDFEAFSLAKDIQNLTYERYVEAIKSFNFESIFTLDIKKK